MGVRENDMRVYLEMDLPESVWGLVKEYAIPRCPACRGCCAYEDMPCWLDDMSQRSPHVRLMDISGRQGGAETFRDTARFGPRARGRG